MLLIACVNVANLQMARLTARRGELSVRMALGAGRRRIVRQLLTEAVVLSLLGASLGVMLAWLAIGVTLPLVPQSLLPGLGGIVIDARVMVFCLGLSLVSTLLIGLVPALRVSGAAFGEGLALHAGAARTTGDRQGERLRTLLVAGQIAMTLVLLIGAGLLIHSFVRLTSVSTGFESSGRDGVVQTVRVTLPERLADEPERIHAFARGVLDRIQSLPGVTSASLINSMPFGRMFIQGDFDIEGQPKPTLFAGTPKIEPGYFKTMGIPLLAGREFTPQDTAAAMKVAIVSERIVRECFPGGPGQALGRRVRVNVIDRGEWLTVVGVVADIRQMSLERDVQPMIYVPFQQDHSGFLRFVAFVARTSTPGSVVEGIRAEIRHAAPDLPIQSTVTMDEAVAASVAQPRFRMVLLALFAVTATLIATCGLYGLMAYAVTQRRREIGVRMALGADRRDVLRLVLTRALRIVVAGLIVGLAGAVGVTRVLQTVPVRGDADRSDRVHDRHAAADGGGTDGGMAARAPRDTDRPVRRAARGIAVNGSDLRKKSGGIGAGASAKSSNHPSGTRRAVAALMRQRRCPPGRRLASTGLAAHEGAQWKSGCARCCGVVLGTRPDSTAWTR